MPGIGEGFEDVARVENTTRFERGRDGSVPGGVGDLDVPLPLVPACRAATQGKRSTKGLEVVPLVVGGSEAVDDSRDAPAIERVIDP